MSEPILYLMDKYTNDEQASVKRNQDAWLELTSKGHHVFSPICHTHHIEEYRQQLEQESPNNLLAKPIDYVARDLRLIEAWLKHDANLCQSSDHYSCGKYKTSLCQTEDWERCDQFDIISEYDSGVVGIVLPSAYHMEPSYNERQYCGDVVIWNSKGAKAEYEFMKSKHILVISLETALTVPRERWEEYAL